jgi:hypothetical protein
MNPKKKSKGDVATIPFVRIQLVSKRRGIAQSLGKKV